MLEVPVYNVSGKKTGSMTIDEADLGGHVRPPLLKQAVVMYQSNHRVGTATLKGRGDVQGSTRKLYRQKGTGNARMGNNRTPIRRGGGVAFAKKARDFGRRMPKRMRRLACRNALLAKILADDVLIVEELGLQAPQTRQLQSMLVAVGAGKGCLLAVEQPDQNIYKSSRNIPRTEVLPVRDLNAHDVLRRNKLVLTKAAFEQLKQQVSGEGSG